MSVSTYDASAICYLLAVVLDGCGCVQDFAVLEVLSEPLKHRQRFRKVHRHRDLSQILPYRILNDAPKADRNIGPRGAI